MRRRLAIAALGAVVMSAVPVALAPIHVSAAGVVFVVNSTSDRADRDEQTAPTPSTWDGACETSVAGECTLRAAMGEAGKVAAGPVEIDFAIPGTGVQTIQLTKRLPLVDNANASVTINGFTQPGSSVNTDPLVDNAVRNIELVGTGPTGIEGIVILSKGNTVKGLVLHGFLRAVRITGKPATNNKVVGNIVGLLPNGDLDPKYTSVVGSPCIDLNAGANLNKIGMAGVENRNVISGCYEKGVGFYDPFTSGNTVQNNIIGLDPTGTKRRGSKSMAVDINWSANSITVGGTPVSSAVKDQVRNVISGNNHTGVEISHGTGTVNDRVIGNFIGTDPTGNFSNAVTSNLLGVRLEGKPDCGTKACPLDMNKATVTDNVIVGSTWGGILVDKGTHHSTIARNRIGVTLDGTIVGNAGFGVAIHAGATNITVGPGNVIAGDHMGIRLSPFSADPAGSTPSTTQFDTFTQNSIITTGGLGIDFNPYDTVNQNGNGQATLNQKVDVPGLALTGGQVQTTTCANCKVELFATTAAVGSFGPGNTYIATAVADAGGAATFDAPTSGWPARVTATTTTPEGSTSEFAANIATAPVAPPAAVTATSMVPRALGQAAANRQIKLTGSGFAAGTKVTMSGTGATVKSVTFTSATVLTLIVSVAATAPVGPRDVVVTAPAGVATCVGCFTVNPAPVITSVTPSALVQGNATTVDVVGSNFNSGAKITVSGTGIAVGTVTRVDATHLRTTLTVDAAATVGARTLKVVNTDVGESSSSISVTAG